MCGIAGMVGDRTPADPWLDGVAARLHHRGPDARGRQLFARCALVHTRLRVLDLSPAGDQPMSNEDGTVWAVFNGEIYNFGELRAGLEASGHRFRSGTDTEVLVHLYEEAGERMTERLRGMFAFAVWDERAQTLLLARDRLGIKPLYYRHSPQRLRFASEVRALSAPNDTLDAHALSGFLGLGWISGPNTVRAGTCELPPAHRLTWRDGAISLTRYWSPPIGEADGGRDELSTRLADSVNRHLVSDAPLGLFLSSGVDSSVLAALSARARPDIRTFTVAYESGPDEVAGAAAVARRLGLRHTVVRVSGSDVVSSLDQIIADMDQPTVDGVNSWVVSRAVRDEGTVVALSGLGGDELFGGYSTFRHVPRLARVGQLAARVPSAAAADRLLGRVPVLAHSRVRRAGEAIASGGIGPAYVAVRGLFGAQELREIWPRTTACPSDHLAPPTDGQGGRQAVGQLEVANYLPFQLLRDTDCMSMAHGLEVRVPLLDDDVVAVALPQLGLGRSGWSKAQLVAAVDPALRHLASARKQTFTLPFARWLRGPLRDWALGALRKLGSSGLDLDRRRLSEVWFGFEAGRVGWRPIWALSVLGSWLEQHCDGEPRLS